MGESYDERKVGRHVFVCKGGVRIGCFHATWPFAQLSVAPGQLTITVLRSEVFSFFPGQVVAIDSVAGLPLIRRGIRMTHTIGEYPETVVFLCLSDPAELIARIRAEGFHPQGAHEAMPERLRELPVTGKAIAAAVAVWNVPLLFSRPGLASLFGAALLFAGSLAIRRSDRLQSFVLKPGRGVDEVRDVLMTVKCLTAALMLLFAVLMLSGLF